MVGLLACIPSSAQILHKKKKPADKAASADTSAQPDKVLAKGRLSCMRSLKTWWR